MCCNAIYLLLVILFIASYWSLFIIFFIASYLLLVIIFVYWWLSFVSYFVFIS